MTLTLKYRFLGSAHQEKIRVDFCTALRDKLRPDSNDTLSLQACLYDNAVFTARFVDMLLKKGVFTEDEAVELLHFGQFPHWEKAE